MADLSQLRTLFSRHLDDPYLLENFNSFESFKSREDFQRLVTHCFQRVDQGIRDFWEAGQPFMAMMEYEEQSGHNIDPLPSLRAVRQIINQVMDASHSILLPLRIMKSTLDELERTPGNPYDMEGPQGELAWTAFIWLWAAWRTDCMPILLDLGPILEQYITWNPPFRKARDLCLQTLEALCNTVLNRRARDEYPNNWLLALRRANPAAFEWWEDLHYRWHQTQWRAAQSSWYGNGAQIGPNRTGPDTLRRTENGLKECRLFGTAAKMRMRDRAAGGTAANALLETSPGNSNSNTQPKQEYKRKMVADSSETVNSGKGMNEGRLRCSSVKLPDGEILCPKARKEVVPEGKFQV
ncbi:hypothetical protein V8F20_003956 [Naviculisporaceae sp. PSN 640]